MKMSEDERQCLSESRRGSANVISIFSYCARRYSILLCSLQINYAHSIQSSNIISIQIYLHSFNSIISILVTSVNIYFIPIFD